MVGPGEVDEYLEPETFEECGKYGKVIKCLIFEVSAGLGKYLTRTSWKNQILIFLSVEVHHFEKFQILTLICQVDPSILNDWKSPIPILGVSGVLFHFYFW